MAEKPRVCIDCRNDGRPLTRPAPHPGPRCSTHHRAKKTADKDRARARRWESVYSLSAEQYAAILEAQGGYCAICGIANGRSRALSVDHDHSCCPGPTSCGDCVRSLLCRPCNDFLGYIRDDLEAAQRLVDHLIYPIGRKVLDNWGKR